MGTHPIFESDFDCLTENEKWPTVIFQRLSSFTNESQKLPKNLFPRSFPPKWRRWTSGVGLTNGRSIAWTKSTTKPRVQASTKITTSHPPKEQRSTLKEIAKIRMRSKVINS